MSTRISARLGVGLAVFATVCAGATLAASAPAGAADGSSVTVGYDGFPNSDGLSLVGTAQVRPADSVIQLTRNVGDQAGAVWFPQGIDPSRDFSTDFTINLHDSDGCHADGLDFVIQNSAAGSNAIGDPGGAMGYSGIENSFASEFDIYGQNTGDPSDNHAAFVQNGDPDNADNPPDWASSDVPTLYGNGPIHAWLDYTAASETVELFVGTTTTKPTTPVLDVEADLGSIIGSTNAFAGFTASTGGCNAVQDVQNWHLTAANGVPANTAVTLSSNPAGPSRQTRPTFTATVARNDGDPTPVTGTVNFSVDGSPVGSAPVGADGTASYTPSTALTAGTHTVKAGYGGDGVASPGTSTLSYVCQGTDVRILPTYGSTIDYGARVNAVVTQIKGGPKATGTMDWLEYNSDTSSFEHIVTTKVIKSKTMLPATILKPGHQYLEANYSGDKNYAAGSTYGYTELIVAQARTSITLTSTLDPAPARSRNYVIATVKPEFLSTQVSGTVTFSDGGSDIATVTVTPQGIAKLPTRTLSSGSHPVTAIYNGDANFTGVASDPYDQKIS